MNRNDSFEPDDAAAPAKLVAALRDALRGSGQIPPDVDEAVRSAAQRHFARAARAARRSRRVIRLVPWLGAAAAVLAAALIAGFFAGRERSPDTARFAPEDVDGNGQVDILDALTLARRIERRESTPASFDLNGDGRVDARDVSAIAARAVRLGEGPGG